MRKEKIRENIARLRDEVAESAQKRGRSLSDIRILAATKTRNISEIKPALEAGMDLIGENTIQDALDKFEFLPSSLEKHFIGHLQPNKAREAVMLFDLIQSVDTIQLAEQLSQRAQEIEKQLPILIEINTSQDSNRWGIKPQDIFETVQKISTLEGLEIEGLMSMPPYHEDPEKLRPQFRKIKELADELEEERGIKIRYLSMGISNDFKVAIEEGSNLVRIGSYIFGSRDYR